MSFFYYLTCNRILNISVLAWLIAQALKVIITLIWDRKFDFSRIWEGGGMPSSHSALVCACASTIGKVYGISTPYFAIAVVVAFVVMYDASNVRRAAGEQAKILNYMMDHWKEGSPEFFSKELKEFLGHTPLQVFFGGILGIFLGVTFG